MENWEFNVLGIYNYRGGGKLNPYFGFIVEHHDRIPGDIVEAGVFRGRSFLATAMLLRDLDSTKKIYGYDSFSGFPPVYDPNDDGSAFDRLLAEGRISQSHYDQSQRLKVYRRLIQRGEPDVKNLSTSGDFSQTSLDTLRDKVAFLGLDKWVEICPGPFDQTMVGNGEPNQIMAATLDCDLYGSYHTALNFIWPRLTMGGYVWLDEYYSLKFPGARIATDEFFAQRTDKPQMHEREEREFERWYVRKLSG